MNTILFSFLENFKCLEINTITDQFNTNTDIPRLTSLNKALIFDQQNEMLQMREKSSHSESFAFTKPWQEGLTIIHFKPSTRPM